ncbi:Hemoglobin and hemoglobin-haptoglobin-binding protein A precursor, partial [Haemophilus influenzae]
LLNN